MKEVNGVNKSLQNDMVEFFHKTTRENIYDFQLHCHSYFEIYYFISGNAEYMVEGKHYELKPKTMFLLGPGVVHGVKADKDTAYERYAFHFMPEYIPKEHREILLAPFFENSILYENTEMERWFDNVLDAAELPKQVKEIAISSRFEAMLSALYALKNHNCTEEKSELFDSVVKYINDHITEEISLGDIADNFYISKSQLNRVFKKNMNTTVWNYIGIKRVNMARQLIYRGESAENAAVASGFSDYSTFYRTYKKVTGHSPAETVDLILR